MQHAVELASLIKPVFVKFAKSCSRRTQPCRHKILPNFEVLRDVVIAEQAGVVLEGMSLNDLEQGKAASTSSGSKSQGKGKDKSKKTKNPLDEKAE